MRDTQPGAAFKPFPQARGNRRQVEVPSERGKGGGGISIVEGYSVVIVARANKKNNCQK